MAWRIAAITANKRFKLTIHRSSANSVIPSYFNYRMWNGDVALFYHSRSGKNVFGIMQVSKPPYQDLTTNAANWLAIDFEPIKTFEPPISANQD